MLRDVFYFGNKPNAHPREKFAKNLEDARNQCTTDHFWVINEHCDYSGFEWDFDFDFLPDEEVWAENHINVWPSTYQKDSGTWLVASNDSELIIYRNDVTSLKRKNIKTDNWKLLDKIDEAKFDFGWHPDPTAPPYIYRWGNKFYPVELMGSIEYVVPGATQIKYMKSVAELLPDWEHWEIPDYIDKHSFDFSWRPDPREPALIYDFGTQWHKTGGPRYVCPDASEVKCIEGMKARALPRPHDPYWQKVEGVELEHFDYTWYPDHNDQPFIYVFGNQHYGCEIMPTMEYIVPGATEKKYIKDCWGTLAQRLDNWVIPDNVDTTGFDFSWRPNPYDPPYIYQFGTQWQKTHGPRYVSEGATEIKYMSDKVVKILPDMTNWIVPDNIDVDSFDFSWHPDSTEEGYIYQFGTQWGEEGGPIYATPDATIKKYVTDLKAKALIDYTKWSIPEDIDLDSFDFSWQPDVEDKSYVYQFGTQHQKTGGPRYIGNTNQNSTVKYVDVLKATKLPNKSKFEITEGLEIEDFDYSWHPDDTEPPYIYVFGNQHYEAEILPTVRYVVEGASYTKYLNNIRAVLAQNKSNWLVPENIDDRGFDYSWIPNPKEPAYIYIAGTQWQKTGGPRYIVEGSTEIKYIDQKVRKLPEKTKFNVIDDINLESFDYSWHPDDTEPPYIYVFGNQHYEAEIMPTVEYHVEGAEQTKYVNDNKAVLGQMKDKWIVPNDIDDTGFDYSWIPNPKDPAYIYVAGTQHQKTGGPKFIVEGAVDYKYIDYKVKKLQDKSKFQVLSDFFIEDFDYSWHPDETEPAYIYVFGNQHYSAEKMPTVQYEVEGATDIKYVIDTIVKLAQDKRNWSVPKNIDVSEFDFSWKPDPNDPPYIYRFGTQWQKTHGPVYTVENATEVKYMSGSKARMLPNATDPKWQIPEDVDVSEFDFSWHPDATDSPYIYQFGTQWQKTRGPRYVIPGALATKYERGTVAKILPKGDNWEIPDGIDLDSFDFSWHPDDTVEKPYIYQFGTQHQKTGGPKYISPGAMSDSEVVYVDRGILKVIRLPNKKNWTIPANVDATSIDYSWHPDDTEPSYIYEFSTVWNDRGGPIYTVPGALQVKYISKIKAKTLPDKSKWDSLIPVDESKFDYSWVPHPNDPPYIYVFGNQWNTPEVEPTMEYHVEGAKEIKYIHDLRATALPDKRRWTILHAIDEDSFDFSWRPNPKDPAYIYVFGNQHYPAEKMPTLEYRIEGATEYKYINDIKAKLVPMMDRWNELIPIDKTKFNFDWIPDPGSPPYIYVFGNTQYPAEIMPTIEYVVPGATEVKYVSTIVATLAEDRTNWEIPNDVDVSEFDFSWKPNPKDPPYIYQFGTQWQKTHGPRYVVPSATQLKYVEGSNAKALPNKRNWVISEGMMIQSFDYSWHPDATENAYIYVFGNQWNKAEVESTIEYHVPGATVKKYVSSINAYVSPDMARWEIPNDINVKDFDFTWRPDPGAPKYIYQFGTLANDNDGPRYTPLDSNGTIVRLERVYKPEGYSEEVIVEEKPLSRYTIKTTLEELINEHPDEIFWAMRDNIDYSKFNFDWKPSIEQARYIHVFGSPDSELTQTYFVSSSMYKQGYKDFNYVEADKKIDAEYLATLFRPSDVFFVDRGNVESRERFERLKEKFPEIQKTRFLNSWVDTINRCINRSNTELCWILNSELDYSNFNFNYYPDPWQMQMVHVFGTQWSHWGTTFMVNKTTFADNTKYVKIIEHLNNLNFVKDRKAKATNNTHDVYLIDHGNDDLEKIKNYLTNVASKEITVVKYNQNYVTTIKDIVSNINTKKEHHIWICSSICDYQNFDFTYIVDPFSKDNLHVFPSNNQKFGDTFFIDVNMTQDVIENLDKLQSYPKVSYNQTLKTSRLPPPVIDVITDTHVGSLNIDFSYPYAIFRTENIDTVDNEPMCLWDNESKNILVTTTGGSRIIVPREAKDIVKNELYDYPYIKTASKLGKSKPLDIVFLSNGELCADENYEHLLAVTKGLSNRVVRVDGVDGRVEAYHAALEASESNWAFTVFAKLKVNSKFDWNWQPDRLQIPKHYIFHAKNPINGLEYGHQGMIAYNKKLTLANQGKGLDFTLDDPHETVELLSGVATFNTDPYATWRTAFRETIKLKSDYSEIAEQRLNAWLTIAEGDFARDCLQGAQDAVEYYDSVTGDIEELKKSYEWAWLKEFYRKKYK